MLDPDDPAATNCFWTPAGETSAALREFGKYPNTADWLPGDILLVRSVKPDWITRRIVRVQSRSYHLADACWQHAAVYMGNSFIAQATTRGVRYDSIEQFVGKYHLRLRRNPKLMSDQRWLVAIEAGVRLRAAYGFADILRIYRSSFPGLRRQLAPNIAIQARSVICSQLCWDAHSALNQIIVPRTGGRPITPASLSQTKLLEDVPLHWCAIR